MQRTKRCYAGAACAALHFVAFLGDAALRGTRVIVAITQLGVDLGQHEQMIRQLAYFIRQIDALPGTAPSQQIGRVRVSSIECMQIALHAAPLLCAAFAAGELIEVLVEQMLWRGRGTTRRARCSRYWEQLLAGFINGRGSYRMGTVTAALCLFLKGSPSLLLIVRQRRNRLAWRGRTNCKSKRILV